MPNERMIGKSLEDIKLEKREIELAELEDELADCQSRLTALTIDVNAFERTYFQVVGVLYSELDDIKAQVAEAYLALNPSDQEASHTATAFRAHAQESAKEVHYPSEQGPKLEALPSDNLKQMFREAAKRIHPDLATSEDDRVYRHQAMTEINSAYEAGDEDRLCNIIQGWNDFQALQEGGLAVKLARVIHRIASLKKVIIQRKVDIEKLRTSNIGKLLAKSDRARLDGRNLLLERATSVRAEIAREREKLVVIANKGENI